MYIVKLKACKTCKWDWAQYIKIICNRSLQKLYQHQTIGKIDWKCSKYDIPYKTQPTGLFNTAFHTFDQQSKDRSKNCGPDKSALFKNVRHEISEPDTHFSIVWQYWRMYLVIWMHIEILILFGMPENLNNFDLLNVWEVLHSLETFGSLKVLILRHLP